MALENERGPALSELTGIQIRNVYSPERIPPELSRFQYLQQTQWDPIPGPNLHQTIRNAFACFQDREWLGTWNQETKTYTYKTFDQIWDQMIQFGSGLSAFCAERSLIGIFSENREEWIVSDLACVFYNFVSVPLANTLDEEQLSYIVNHAELSCVVCTSANIDKVLKILPHSPSVRLVVQCEPLHKKPTAPKVMFTDFACISQRGKEEWKATQVPQEQSTMTLLYTSGSTGNPKGAMNSFSRWNAFVSVLYAMAHPLVRVCDQPLAHATERQLTWLTLCFGGKQCFSTGDMNRIFDEFQLVGPTQITGSPRLFDFIYSQFQAALLNEIKKRPNEDHVLLRAEIMPQFRKLLGDRIQFLIIGGAASSEHLRNFLAECWNVPIYDGYGTTEAGSIASNKVYFPNVEVRLVSVPEFGYTTEDLPYPRGHIYVKTPQMISGYYKDEKTTNENFENGWFKTGDIGEMRDGVVHIIDRCKNIMKLSSGLFVEPSRIEGILASSPFIEQIYVHGEIGRSYLVAVVVPNEIAVKEWAKENGISCENVDNFYADERLKKMLLQSFLAVGLPHGMKRYEFPASVYLSKERFTPENGMMTISSKPLRRGVAKYFEANIAQLFEVLDQKRLILAAEIGEVVKGALGNQHLNEGDDILEQMGTDSLSTVKIMNVIKNNFGKDIPRALLEENGSLSVQDLADYLVSATEIGDNIHSAKANLYLEAEKDFKEIVRTNYVVPPFDADQLKIKNPQNVLLTGASGFLGIFLLKQLLEDLPESTVHCFIRCKTSEDGMKRVMDNFRQRRIELKQGWENRIKVYSSDLSLPNFGLSDNDYDTLSTLIDNIYHCGAIVNWLMRYRDIRGANVTGTTRIINFALTNKVKPLYYVSTISTGPHEEGSLFSPDDAFKMGAYALSKWIAEHAVIRASFSGLPVMIFKPGMVTGDDQNGAMNEGDFFPTLFRGVVAMKSCFYSDQIMELNPVNFVASAIINISRSANNFGETPKLLKSFTYHVTNPYSLSFTTIFNMISSLGNELVFRSYAEWRQDLLNNHASGPLGPFLNILGDTFNFSMHTLRRSNLERALAELGLPDVQPPTTELIQKCLLYSSTN